MSNQRVVWKYEVNTNPSVVTEQEIPEGFVLLHVAAQSEIVCIWALVDPYAEMRTHRFRCLLTGHRSTDISGWVPVGTALLSEGSFVAHVFLEDKAMKEKFVLAEVNLRHAIVWCSVLNEPYIVEFSVPPEEEATLCPGCKVSIGAASDRAWWELHKFLGWAQSDRLVPKDV